MATIVGQVLNERYEVLEKIGEGGMAIAYRGRDRLLGRTVAIKVMRPELAGDAAFLARFRREARAAAGIAHEHIAAVYDTGSDGPYHYIVMEYVEGESLRDRLRRQGPLPLAEALRIAAETADALEAAHSAGVVHRDIKPHNILVGRDGAVKVTDFGIARAASAPGHAETSAVIGSVNYMSPEQARGDPVGPQADIYSLGATLFEMLIGRAPFDGGDKLAILHKHVYDRAPRPSELRPGLPPEVDSVVAHCLEKDLSRRYASARELISYLAACPPDEDPSALRRVRGRATLAAAERAVGAANWLQRRLVWLLLLALALAGMVVGVTLWASARARDEMVATPDVLGMSAKAAGELLASRGLELREMGERASEEVPAGAVLTQDPAAGLAVAPGAVVKVVLSQGPSHVTVPDVTQMSAAQAQRNLEAAGLASGDVREEFSDEAPAGYVAATLPAAGAKVVRATAVDIILSQGPEPPTPGDTVLPGVGPSVTGREETLTFVVPADGSPRQGEVQVAVEVVDEAGRRRIYQGRHRPGDRIPAQTIRVSSPTTARIYVDGRLRAERQYLP